VSQVSPLIVQQQLRRHSIASTERRTIGATAVTAACEAIDAMSSQVRFPIYYDIFVSLVIYVSIILSIYHTCICLCI